MEKTGKFERTLTPEMQRDLLPEIIQYFNLEIEVLQATVVELPGGMKITREKSQLNYGKR